jgi:hypothetical protein
MLPSAPPRFTTWAALVAPIKEGETGWRPYALQVGVDALGQELEPDGNFGPATKRAVIAFQQAHGLVGDGIAGGATQAKILALLGSRVHKGQPDVPDGLMRGFAEGEGANVLAATNWTVVGGVDCGAMQYRVFGPPYSAARLEFAFDPLAAMVAAATEFLDRYRGFVTGAWVRSRPAGSRAEAAKRCAIMAHNWPAAAQQIASNGACSSPNSLATWVAPGTKFPDGAPVRTRAEWCAFYAMGGSHGEASIPKYVTSWT